MSTISIRLPDSLHQIAKTIAAEDHVSMNQFIASAVAKKVSALTAESYLKECGERASAEMFRTALVTVPDGAVIPVPEVGPVTEQRLSVAIITVHISCPFIAGYLPCESVEIPVPFKVLRVHALL